MIVVDASALIALTKIGRLRLLPEVYGEGAIAPAVRREVVEKGRAVGAPEVRQIERAIEEQWIREVRLTVAEKKMARQMVTGARLGQGESESLALARYRNWTVVLDDKEARWLAETAGVEYLGTAGVLLEALVAGRFDYDELQDAAADLGKVLWLSPDVVAEILKRAKGVRR